MTAEGEVCEPRRRTKARWRGFLAMGAYLARFPLVELLVGLFRHAPPRVRLGLAGFYLLAFGAQIVGLLRPLALGHIFTVIESGVSAIPGPFLSALGLYFGLELGFLALHIPSRMVERRLAFRVRRTFYEEAYATIARRPLEWHRLHHSGDTIDRLRKAGEGLFGFAEQQFRWIQTFFGIVGPMVMLGILSWPLALLTVSANAAVLFGVSRFDRVIVRAMKDQNEAEHRFSTALFDYVAHMTTILSLRLGERTKKEVVDAHDAAEPPFRRHVLANETKYAGVSTALGLLEISTLGLFVALELTTRGSVRIGVAVAVFRYLNQVGKTFYEAAYTYQDLLHRQTDLSAAKPLFADAPPIEPSAGHPPWAWSRVEVRDLRYRHPGADGACLDGVGLTLDRGQKVALVGASGAGKSTLLAALRGLLEPETMRLLLDGAPTRDVARFRAGVVLVPQEPELFESTLRFNVTGGLPCREADIEAALHDARFDEVLPRLPRGLETDVRERGVNLSGGERQRLALARALLLAQDARLLLLDEATSSVDRDTERAIYARIFARFWDRTVLASIHGLHLLPAFDRVIVLDRGRVVESGSVETLIEGDGLLARAVRRTTTH